MPPARRSRFQYDVFVSYSHRNKEWVREWLVTLFVKDYLFVEEVTGHAYDLGNLERAVL
jgi:hypothetical protein